MCKSPSKFTYREQALRRSLGTVRVMTVVPEWERKAAVIRKKARCPGQQSNHQDEDPEDEKQKVPAAERWCQLWQADSTMEIMLCCFLKIHHRKIILSEPPEHLAFYRHFQNTPCQRDSKHLPENKRFTCPFHELSISHFISIC